MRAEHTFRSSSFTPSPAAVLRRKCACGGSSSECDGCRKKEESLQRSATDEAAIETIPSAVHETLQSPGHPLDDATRAYMEPRFGHDFSQVRVHTDARAAESARQVHASAYTLGRHIVFAGGSPALDSASGRHLLAHELAHAVQQEGVAAAGANVRVGSPGDPEEHHAHAAAEAVEAGGTPFGGSASGASRARSGPAVRRQPQDDNPRKPPEDKRPEPFKPTGAPTVDIPGVGEMEVNPTVIAPDMDGVPDFMRGKEVKLSDLRKALAALGIGKGKKDPKGEKPGACEAYGMERGEFREVAGLCCPKLVRDPDKCCELTNVDIFERRCCRPTEVAVHGKCVTPEPVPLPVKKLPTPPPNPPPTPTPQPAPVPVSTVVFFDLDKPSTAAKGEEGLKKSVTSEGSKNFDALVKELKDNPTFKVQLAGRASSEGPSWYNLGLAGRRARLVADVLVAMGVDRSRIAEPPDGGSECKKVEDGIHNCGETGASPKVEPNDRQVRAQVFTTP